MAPKIDGKSMKKGRRGGKKPKNAKAQAEEEEMQHSKGNAQDAGYETINQHEADLSLLTKPMEISVTGVRQLLKIFQTATSEMQEVLSTECDLVYECKVCRSLYRSVANFLSHKRSYCKEHYSNTRHVFPMSHQVEDQLVIIQPEPVPVAPCSDTWIKNDSSTDPNQNVTSEVKPEISSAEIKSSVPPISSYTKPKRNLSQIIEDLSKGLPNYVEEKQEGPVSAVQFYTSACEKVSAQKEICREQILHLEAMEETSCGVFQTLIAPASTVENTDLMKVQVAELHGMITANEATLGPVGEIVVINGEGKTVLVDTTEADTRKPEKRKSTPSKAKKGIMCSICNLDFETRKTYMHHNSRYHAASRVHYPCPCCRDTFANAWNVYRHLYKVHRKSSAQVRRLRSKVLNKVFTGKVPDRESHSTRKKQRNAEALSEVDKAKQEQERMEKENQDWMHNLEEDFELQMCGGCGRRFERRAALNSHSQTCAKRIELRKKTNRFYPISTVGSSSNVQNSNLKVPLFIERAHSTRSETLAKTEITYAENIPSRLTPVSMHSEGTVSSGAKSGTSPPHSPATHEPIFPVPVPLVPTTMYLRTPSNNANPEKKIEIQIRRNYFKSEMGSVNTPAVLGSTNSVSQHSLGKSVSHSVASTVISADPKPIEHSATSSQPTVVEQSRESSIFEREVTEPSMALRVDGTDDGYEGKEVKACLSLSSNLGDNRQPSSGIANANTADPTYKKTAIKLNESKEIKNFSIDDKLDEDGNEHVANTIICWRNYPNGTEECSADKHHLQDDCNVKDVMQQHLLISELDQQKMIDAKDIQGMQKSKLTNRPTKSTFSKIKAQNLRSRKKVRKGKWDCYVNRIINGKKKECVVCHKKYNKIARYKRQVANKIGYYSYQCMQCNSRYLSKASCLAHISNMHDIHKMQAIFQLKCIRIMLSHSKALRLRSAKAYRIRRKCKDMHDTAISKGKEESVQNDDNSRNILAMEEPNKEEDKIEENSENKNYMLRKMEEYSENSANGNKSANINLAERVRVQSVKSNEESEQLSVIDDHKCENVETSLVGHRSWTTNKKEYTSKVTVGDINEQDANPETEGVCKYFGIEDRKEHNRNENVIIEPKGKSLLQEVPFYSMAFTPEISINERPFTFPEQEMNIKGEIGEHHFIEKVKDSTKRKLINVKPKNKRRKSAINESTDSFPACNEKYKPSELNTISSQVNSSDIAVINVERKQDTNLENTVAETVERRKILTQNASVMESILKALGGKYRKTETVVKDDCGDEPKCSDMSETYPVLENGDRKRLQLSNESAPDMQMQQYYLHSNCSNIQSIDINMFPNEDSHPSKQISSAAKDCLLNESMMLPPLRRSRRLSGQKSVNETDHSILPLEDFTKTIPHSNGQDKKRHSADRSSSPSMIPLGRRHRVSAQASLVKEGGNIITCMSLNDLQHGSNSSEEIQGCGVVSATKQELTNCETDIPSEVISATCDDSLLKDGNYLLPENSVYLKEESVYSAQKKLRQTKAKRKQSQSLMTIKENQGDEKRRCLADKSQPAVSDVASDRIKHVDEDCGFREEADIEEITPHNAEIKYDQAQSCLISSHRRGRMRSHNPAAVSNAGSNWNRAESIGPNEIAKQPILPKDTGTNVSNDEATPVPISLENLSSSSEANENQTALRKLVMEVIFGTGQDCNTTQQILSATLNGTGYDSQYAQYVSSPSSSIDTSPSSSVCSPVLSSNDATYPEETLKAKEESKIMAQKKTVLNSFPEKKQRPVRNRIKLEKEDFIYDLPDRCRDTRRDGEDRLSNTTNVTRNKQQPESTNTSTFSNSDGASSTQMIPRIVLVRTNNSVQTVKTENDAGSPPTENSLGSSESLGLSPMTYKISKRKSQVLDPKCKPATSNKERID